MSAQQSLLLLDRDLVAKEAAASTPCCRDGAGRGGAEPAVEPYTELADDRAVNVTIQGARCDLVFCSRVDDRPYIDAVRRACIASYPDLHAVAIYAHEHRVECEVAFSHRDGGGEWLTAWWSDFDREPAQDDDETSP